MRIIFCQITSSKNFSDFLSSGNPFWKCGDSKVRTRPVQNYNRVIEFRNDNRNDFDEREIPLTSAGGFSIFSPAAALLESVAVVDANIGGKIDDLRRR